MVIKIMVFVGQTNILQTLVQNINTFIYKNFTNSHTRFEYMWNLYKATNGYHLKPIVPYKI